MIERQGRGKGLGSWAYKENGGVREAEEEGGRQDERGGNGQRQADGKEEEIKPCGVIYKVNIGGKGQSPLDGETVKK